MATDPVELGTAMNDFADAVRNLDRGCHEVSHSGDYPQPTTEELAAVLDLLTKANEAAAVVSANTEGAT